MPLVLLLAAGAVPRSRTHPEWSDLALFALAAASVWLVRRALRTRLQDRELRDRGLHDRDWRGRRHGRH